MKVCEIFSSLCGEVNVGRLALFIRLAECNLNCSFCFGVRKNQSNPKIILSRKPNKKITDVIIGDKLLTLDNNHNIVETEVKEVINREVDKWYIIKIKNKRYFVTPEHIFFTTTGEKKASNLSLNDEIIHINYKDKLSFLMKKKNPMFEREIVIKSVIHTDYQKMGKTLSNTIKKQQNEGIYISPWNKLSKEHKNKLRKLHSERMIGLNNSNYSGKNSNLVLLKKQCKNNILKICKMCNKTSKLIVHHLDNNHDNDNIENLITLCNSCHNKIHKRGYSFWKNNNRKDNKILNIESLSLMKDWLAIQHNGLKIDSIKLIDRSDKKYKYEYQKPKSLKTYNFRCEPYNTFLVNNMLVHNCDTNYARNESFDIDINEIVEQAKHFSRVVITGGEPMLQKDEVANFIKRLRTKSPETVVEIETNGTIKPLGGIILKDVIFNVSIKLKNSGNKYEDRIKHETIGWYAQANANFKFVVTSEDDIDEVTMIVKSYGIRKRQVFLMPEGKTRAEQLNVMLFVADFAKALGYNFSPRMHVLLWDNKRGV